MLRATHKKTAMIFIDGSIHRPKKQCLNLLEGYQTALKDGGCPFVLDMDKGDADDFFDGLTKDGEPSAYIFRCLHCNKYLACTGQD